MRALVHPDGIEPHQLSELGVNGWGVVGGRIREGHLYQLMPVAHIYEEGVLSWVLLQEVTDASQHLDVMILVAGALQGDVDSMSLSGFGKGRRRCRRRGSSNDVLLCVTTDEIDAIVTYLDPATDTQNSIHVP